MFHVCPRKPVRARSESGGLSLWTCLCSSAFPAHYFLVASLLPCCSVLERKEMDSVCRWGSAAFSALRASTFVFSSAPRPVSWKLISEVEIRTVKGREFWCGTIFRSNQGNSQHNPDRAGAPGMASCRRLFRSHFVNFFASFST